MNEITVNSTIVKAIGSVGKGVIKDEHGVEKPAWVITFGREGDERTSYLPPDFSESEIKKITDRLKKLIAAALSEDATQNADGSQAPDAKYRAVVDAVAGRYTHLSELRVAVFDLDPDMKLRPKGGFTRPKTWR